MPFAATHSVLCLSRRTGPPRTWWQCHDGIDRAISAPSSNCVASNHTHRTSISISLPQCCASSRAFGWPLNQHRERRSAGVPLERVRTCIESHRVKSGHLQFDIGLLKVVLRSVPSSLSLLDIVDHWIHGHWQIFD